MSGAGDTIDIVLMREWQDYSTAGGQYGGWAFLLDMDDIRMRTLGEGDESRSTKLLKNRQAPDEDSTKEEYLTEFTLEIGNEKNHAVLKAVTAYS
jgi:hypothetical protein